MSNCEDLLAQYTAASSPEDKAAIRAQMLEAGCPDPEENPQGSGGGGHVDPDGPHG